MKAKPILSHKRNQSETTLKRVGSSFELPQIKNTNVTNTSSILSSKNPTPSDKGAKSTTQSSTRSNATTIVSPTFKKSISTVSTTYQSPRLDILKKTIMNFQNNPIAIPSPSNSSSQDQKSSSNRLIDIKLVKSDRKDIPSSILRNQINTLNLENRKKSIIHSQTSSPNKTSSHQSPQLSPMKFGKPTSKKTVFLVDSKDEIENKSPTNKLIKVASVASIADCLTASPKRLSPRKSSPRKGSPRKARITNPSFGELHNQIEKEQNKENQEASLIKVMPILIKEEMAKENNNDALENQEGDEIIEHYSDQKMRRIVLRKAKTQDEVALRSKSKKRTFIKQGSIDLEERIRETFGYKPQANEQGMPNFSPKKDFNSKLESSKPYENKNMPYFIKENIHPRPKPKALYNKNTFEFESPTSFFSNMDNPKQDVFVGDGVKFFEINENSKIAIESQTPRALRIARQKKKLDKPYSQLKKDYSPVILSYYDIFDTRIVQPKFMEEIGSMCTSELWPNQTKKEYFYRMKDHATIKKTWTDVDGLYKPEKNKKLETIPDDRKVL